MRKLFEKPLNGEHKTDNRIALKGGSYSIAVTAIVLAILIVLNIMVSVLPAGITKLDISSSRLYSITSNTKVVVNSLQKDVTIYWIVQADEEDDVIENLLAKYESLSNHIKVIKKNPDAFPTFAAQYTGDVVKNNSLVVECGDKYRYIPYDDIYLSDIDYETYSVVYSFDGEGAVTSAIDYVVSDDLPKIYLLEGHGESSLPDEFSEQIQKDNMETSSFSLLNEGEIPEDADCIMIYAPSTDISVEEKNILIEYVDSGGKLMVIAGPSENSDLENLYAVLSEYGVESEEGIVVESDRSHYAFGAPYILLPDIQSSTITDPLSEAKYYVIIPIAKGLHVEANGKGTATELLTTSNTAFSKVAGYSLDTYEKEENDINGPFALGVSVEAESGGKIIWISSSYFLEEMYNAYSSGANLDLAMNSLSSLIGGSESIAIRSKSLGYNYLTISETNAAMLKTMMIGVLPLLFVANGIYVTVERRKRKNEQI